MHKNTASSAQIRSNAEETAIAALAWLAGEPELLGRFLALTGLQPDQLRAATRNPDFLGGVLDFLMGHEPTLMAFCEATETRPETVATAAYVFSGQHLGSGEY